MKLQRDPVWELDMDTCTVCRSERFPERDIWFLGTLDQGSAQIPAFLGNRRRRATPRGRVAPPDREFLQFHVVIGVQ